MRQVGDRRIAVWMLAQDAKVRCVEQDVLVPVIRKGMHRSTEMEIQKVTLFCVRIKTGETVVGAPDGGVEEVVKVAMGKYPVPGLTRTSELPAPPPVSVAKSTRIPDLPEQGVLFPAEAATDAPTEEQDIEF
jgi:hypothetical protein